MTEAEWLTCNDPLKMQEFLVDKTNGDRKWWLLLVACCRTAWHGPGVDRIKKHVEVAERYADGLIPESEWRIARRAVEVVIRNPATSTATGDAEAAAWLAGANTAVAVIAVDGEIQCRFFRDIFSNPFRPVTVVPRWLTTIAIGLAETIYAEKAFERLPVLADALEEAGCDNADILTHLRGDGPHVRGCWALDLVLGKQ